MIQSYATMNFLDFHLASECENKNAFDWITEIEYLNKKQSFSGIQYATCSYCLLALTHYSFCNGSS
jgi:hypothetical protein